MNPYDYITKTIKMVEDGVKKAFKENKKVCPHCNNEGQYFIEDGWEFCTCIKGEELESKYQNDNYTKV